MASAKGSWIAPERDSLASARAPIAHLPPRLAALGEIFPLGPELLVNSSAPGVQRGPSIAALEGAGMSSSGPAPTRAARARIDADPGAPGKQRLVFTGASDTGAAGTLFALDRGMGHFSSGRMSTATGSPISR